MTPNNLALVVPSLVWETEYQAMIQECMALDEGHFTNFPLALSDFAAFVTELDDEAAGRNLPPDIFPQQTFWTIRDNARLVGEIRLRPTLVPPFERHNGHTGYNIRPSERAKGYGTRQLALVLAEARKHGLRRVMLPVRAGHTASERIIQRNGGYIQGQEIDPETGEISRFHWIDLAP